MSGHLRQLRMRPFIILLIIQASYCPAIAQELWVSDAYQFSNQPQAKPIPRLYDARFCALSEVAGSSCMIKYVNRTWLAQASGGGTCQAICFRWMSEVFRGLGFLSGDTDSGALGVSANGLVVTGWSGRSSTMVAFRWTESAGMTSLGVLSGGVSSQATATNADGTIIVGYSSSTMHPNGEAFRWTQSGMTGLGTLSAGFSSSRATGVNADGSVVVGQTISSSYPNGEAFQWTQAGGMKGLGVLAGGTFSWATSVNADGSVVVGYSGSTAHPSGEAFRWTQANGMVSLNISKPVSQASAVSADGSVIVGWSGPSPDFHSTGTEAFKWTQLGGLVGLGLDVGMTYSIANGISPDGSIMVGASGKLVGSVQRGTEELLTSNIRIPEEIEADISSTGVNLGAWRLPATQAVSGNNLFVGSGVDPTGHSQAWIAPISPVPRGPVPP